MGHAVHELSGRHHGRLVDHFPDRLDEQVAFGHSFDREVLLQLAGRRPRLVRALLAGSARRPIEQVPAEPSQAFIDAGEVARVARDLVVSAR